MSIRNIKFNNEILPLWNEIENTVKNIENKGLSTDERNEIAHLKKVTAYFSEMLSSIDPDFIPLQILNNISYPLNRIINDIRDYKAGGNIIYIQNINNDYIDTLLRDLMPFIFYKGKASKALQNALSEYTETISEHSRSYLNEIQDLASKARNLENQIELILDNLSDKQTQFDIYDNKLFEPGSGLADRITELEHVIQRKYDDVKYLHNSIFEGNGGLKEQLDYYANEISQQNEAVHILKDDSSQVLEELKNFHIDIFGRENEEGEREGGLKNEIELRKEQLEKFKIQQQERYKELNTQIETLLPGATSAGLSSAYKDMRETFSENAKWYGNAFYGMETLSMYRWGFFY